MPTAIDWTKKPPPWNRIGLALRAEVEAIVRQPILTAPWERKPHRTAADPVKSKSQRDNEKWLKRCGSR